MDISKTSSSSTKGKMSVQLSGTKVTLRKREECIQNQVETSQKNEEAKDNEASQMSLNEIIKYSEAFLSLHQRFIQSIDKNIVKIGGFSELVFSKIEHLKKYSDFLQNQIVIFDKQVRPLIKEMGYDENTKYIDKILQENPKYVEIQKCSFSELLEICHSLAELLKPQKIQKKLSRKSNVEKLINFQIQNILNETKENYDYQKKHKIWIKHLPDFNITETEENIRDYIQGLKIYIYSDKKDNNDIQYWVDKLEESVAKKASELIEQEDKQEQKALLSSVPSSSKQKFTLPTKKYDNETLEPIIQKEALSDLAEEDQYDEKLYAKWKNYFEDKDYRIGEWSDKERIFVPLMENYFPSKMQFILSTKEVITHLKKRHPDILQELYKQDKQYIEDKDGFKPIILSYRKDIHNLSVELGWKLLNENTQIYKSSFYRDVETGGIIDNPAIIVRGKNKKGDMMLSAWGLYKTEKQDGITLNLLSYYKDDSPNKKLPKNTIKISDFSDKVDEEISIKLEKTKKPLTDQELEDLFSDKASLQEKPKENLIRLKKQKAKSKKK